MSLAFGREFLSIPGPSVLPDKVLQAMQRPVANIYEGEIVALTDGILSDLKEVARTEGRPFLYIANGHGAWEAALTNTLSRGDRALVLESGRFAPGWGEMAAQLGVEIETLRARPGRAVDPAALEARLREDAGHAIRAVLVVQVDTASSAANDVAAIRAAIDAAGHPALLMVDVIASQGCMAYEMDAWGVDVTVGGAQKGLMTPPGVAFVWAGPRALAAHERADLRTQYWDWTFRMGDGQYRRFCGTAPVHHLFALRAALDLLLEQGLEATWARHAAMAGAVRAAVAAWAEGGAMRFAMSEPGERADSTTTVLTEGFDPEALRGFLRDRLGLVLGIGLPPFHGCAFRIGHMGWLNAPMLMGTLGGLEIGLRALGVPHGPGALDAAAAALAARA